MDYTRDLWLMVTGLFYSKEKGAAYAPDKESSNPFLS